MRYLVATDGSSEGHDAVEQAAEHAAALGATLDLVHVLAPETELVDGDIVMPGEERTIETGRRTLEQATALASEAAGTEIEPNTELLTGRPADAITRYADEVDADAIYLGHRGLSSEREQVVGSVAKSALDKASVPVMIVK